MNQTPSFTISSIFMPVGMFCKLAGLFDRTPNRTYQRNVCVTFGGFLTFIFYILLHDAATLRVST